MLFHFMMLKQNKNKNKQMAMREFSSVLVKITFVGSQQLSKTLDMAVILLVWVYLATSAHAQER